MGLEEDQDCSYDYVEIYDGAFKDMPLIGRWCGTNKPKTITSTNSQVLIVFKTDDLVDMKGFHIKFKSQNKNLLPKKNASARTTTPVASSTTKSPIMVNYSKSVK